MYRQCTKYHVFSLIYYLQLNYNTLLAKISSETTPLKPSINLNIFTAEYVSINILNLVSYLRNGKKYYYTADNDDADDTLISPDSTIRYPFNKRVDNIDRKQSDKDAQTKPAHRFEGFRELSNQDDFEKLITYKQLVNDRHYNIILDVESYVRHFASSNNIDIFGSYSPNNLNLNNSDFMDAMHGIIGTKF